MSLFIGAGILLGVASGAIFGLLAQADSSRGYIVTCYSLSGSLILMEQAADFRVNITHTVIIKADGSRIIVSLGTCVVQENKGDGK